MENPPFFIGESTISMVIFNSKVLNYQRVNVGMKVFKHHGSHMGNLCHLKFLFQSIGNLKLSVHCSSRVCCRQKKLVLVLSFEVCTAYGESTSRSAHHKRAIETRNNNAMWQTPNSKLEPILSDCFTFNGFKEIYSPQ